MVINRKTIRLLALTACCAFLWNGEGSAEITFVDDFNRTSLGPNWTVAGGIWSINSSNLYHSATTGGVIVLSVPLEGNDFDAQANIGFTDLISGNHRGILLRYQNTSNFYYGQYHRDNRKYRIIKVQNGVWTTLAEVAASGVVNYSFHPIRFVAKGTNLKLYFDGTARLEVNDSTFSAGKVGIYSRSYYHKFDDFRVTTINNILPTVYVDPVSSPTNQLQVTLSGTKSAGSAVYANGTEVFPIGSETVWRASLSLSVEGENNFSAVSRNSNGQESQPVLITVVRDTTPPEVVITSPVLVNNSNYTLTCTVDGEPFSETITLIEGENVLSRAFTDAAGNHNDVDWTITLDSILPSGSVIINGGNAATSDPLVTLALTASDGGSGIDQVRYSPDQSISWTAWENYSSTKQLTLPSGGGLKEVRYQVRDRATNVSTFSDTITLQTVQPGSTTFFDNFNRTSIGTNWTLQAGTWQINSGKLYHASTSGGIITLNVPLDSSDYDAEASFEFTNLVSGNHRGILLRYQNTSNFYYGQYHRDNRKYRIIKVQNGVWTTLAEVAASGVVNYSFHPIRFVAKGTNLKLYFDGTARLEVNDSTFSAGKVGIYSRSYYHKFDDFRVTTINNILPTVYVDPVSSPTNQLQVTLSGTKSAGSAVYANGTEVFPIGSETVWRASLSLSVEGENNFSAVSRNSNGQESQPVLITVVRDTTPPNVLFVSPAPGSYVNQPQPLVYGTVDGVEFSMLAGLSEGANTVTKTAVDGAGNEATATLPLILDTVPPSIEVVSPSYNSWVRNPEVTVRYDCEDEQAVCSSHEVTLELENEGVNEITVVHTDLAGNVGVAKHILRLDSVPPEIIFTSHGEREKIRSSQEVIRYTIDGAPGSLVFSMPNEGENICRIVTEDPAGNFTMAALTLVRDTTPPGFTITYPREGAYINRTEVVLP